MLRHPEVSNRRKLPPLLDPKGERGARDWRLQPLYPPALLSSGSNSLGSTWGQGSLGDGALETSPPGAQSRQRRAEVGVDQMRNISHNHLCRFHQALCLHIPGQGGWPLPWEDLQQFELKESLKLPARAQKGRASSCSLLNTVQKQNHNLPPLWSKRIEAVTRYPHTPFLCCTAAEWAANSVQEWVGGLLFEHRYLCARAWTSTGRQRGAGKLGTEGDSSFHTFVSSFLFWTWIVYYLILPAIVWNVCFLLQTWEEISVLLYLCPPKYLWQRQNTVVYNNTAIQKPCIQTLLGKNTHCIILFMGSILSRKL